MGSEEGPNGVSLVEAQQTFQHLGAMHNTFRRKVRGPRDDEPLDTGWRTVDPERDWTDPGLPGVRWPHNPEALYYWRSTYWNGDPARLPTPPHEPSRGDRLVAHLRQQVSEVRAVVESMEWQYGAAVPMACCRELAELVVNAYEAGDIDTGLRMVEAIAPGLDERSELFAPSCVAVAFLENPAWRASVMQPHIDQWPTEVRDELRRQQQFAAQTDAEMARPTALPGLDRPPSRPTSNGQPGGCRRLQPAGRLALSTKTT